MYGHSQLQGKVEIAQLNLGDSLPAERGGLCFQGVGWSMNHLCCVLCPYLCSWRLTRRRGVVRRGQRKGYLGGGRILHQRSSWSVEVQMGGCEPLAAFIPGVQGVTPFSLPFCSLHWHRSPGSPPGTNLEGLWRGAQGEKLCSVFPSVPNIWLSFLTLCLRWTHS